MASLVANLPHTHRLGGYDDFVDLIQDPFTALLPPEPSPFFKYSAELEGGRVCLKCVICETKFLVYKRIEIVGLVVDSERER